MRAAAIATVAVLSLAVGACSSGGFDDQAGDGALTVYVSAPLRGESGDEGRAIVNGAKLALADAGGEAGGTEVEAVFMDDTSGEDADARWDPVVVADNARRAAQDSTAIAYVGELESGATRASLPITNQAVMLQVSAGSTAIDLTQESSASDDVPALAQPTGERTFGRVIPDDEKQAGAGAVWAGDQEVKSFEVIREPGAFQEVVSEEFTEEAEALGLGRGSGELCYLATEELPRRAGRCGQAMGTDALFDAELDGLQVTSSAQAPEQLPAAGQDFLAAYQEEFGRPADRYAAYGYEAMAVVLDSIDRAEDASDRSAVIDAFLATSERESVLGTYSIDEVGDTTLDAIAGYRVKDGKPRFDSALAAP